MSKELAEKICKEYKDLKGTRINWDSHWEECASYVLPRKEDEVYGFNTPGSKHGNVMVFDSTAPHANELLGSALHGMLTNPTLKWLELTTGDEDLDSKKEVKQWLQDAEDKMLLTLENSNFHTEVHEYYLDLGCFGTSTMLVEEDDKDTIRFSARPIFDAYILEDHKGMISTSYRKIKMKAQSILDKFNIEDDEMIRKLEAKPNKEYEVIHKISPRRDKDNKLKNAKDFTFDSIYVLPKHKFVLEDDGFKENPFIVSRWTKLTSEVYGRSPSMKALPDIKTINRMKRVTIRSAEKSVDPPLLAPDDGVILPLNINPGGFSYYRSGTQDKIEPLFTGSRIDFGFQAISDIQLSIRQAFFIDQLQLNEGPQMTATEVRQRTQEKLRLLGPILARQQNEFLRPLIDRVFGILLRKGEFLDPPEILQDRQVSIRYSSQIAKAQRTSESDSLNLAIQSILPLIEADPSIMDNFNGDKALRHATKQFGISERILKSEEEVLQVRQQRAQQQAQLQQQEQALAEAEVIQKTATE